MKRIIILLPLLVLFYCCTASAAADHDVVLSALTDEIDRSMKNLRSDAHPTPYFISYTVKDMEEINYSSCLGSEVAVDHFRNRILTPVVKVGNYDFDSYLPLSNRPDSSYALPIDDNYAAVRRGVWLNTDNEYKLALEQLEWKKAYLNLKSVTGRLPDMTHEEPVVAIEATKALSYDGARWSQEIPKLSAAFKDYPALQKTKVAFLGRTINRWYVNSEGSRIRECHNIYAVKLYAMTQAPDGTLLLDDDLVASPEESRLPDYDQLKARVDAMAQRLTETRLASRGEDYCGPVLLEGQAAGQLIGQVIAPCFGFAEEYIGPEDFTNPLKNRIGRKVLSKQLSVVDDPFARDSQSNLLIGTYKFDDDGMPGQKINVVENGLLRGFCQSRIPTRHCQHSNGHSMGGHGVFSNLQLSSAKTSSPEELRAKITEIGKEAGLDYVLIISRLGADFRLQEYPCGQMLNERPFDLPANSTRPSSPMRVEKLYLADGRRELVQGLEFKDVGLRIFRDVQAVGDDSKPYVIEPDDGAIRSLITPSYIIGEMELTPSAPENFIPPVLLSPLAAEAAPAKPLR